tara:strand:- start:300 stop:560 length:261 start_codon:yes stop_codon:yes gene_type:complete
MMNTTERDELSSYISDAYKDLYGHRPRFYQWESASLVFLRSEAKALGAQIEYEIHKDRIEMEKALGAMLAYAPDFETAQRWAQEVA